MARCLFTSLTTHLNNHLSGKLCTAINKGLNVKDRQKLISTAFYSSLNSSHCKYPAGTLVTNANINTFLKVKLNPFSEIVRNVIKFSMKDGKRETQPGVTDRFFRLHWGGWIRCKAGRHRKNWTKTAQRRRRLQEHVLCTYSQSKKFDTMVSWFWRRPKYYIEDPYAPYHSREHFSITRTKPWRPEGVDYE